MRVNSEGLNIINRYSEDHWQVGILTAEKALQNLVRVDLTTNQYSALVSLAVNIGLPAFAKSDLLRHVNRRDNFRAAKEFAEWIVANKKEDGQLKARRRAERKLFLRPELVINRQSG